MEELPPAPLATLDEEEDEPVVDEVNTRCGYFGWRPECLHKLNRPAVLVMSIAFYSLSLGFVVNGIINVNASSVERRYDLRSTDIGLISSSYDITAAFLALVVGFYGSGQRKARMLAIAIFCSALGSLIISLPHFITDNYHLGLSSSDTFCQNEQRGEERCSTQGGKSTLYNYYYVFLAGQLLHGVGGTTMFTVGVALIDDSVMPNRTPLFLGIVYGCSIIGAGLGYLIGGQLLNIYVDFDTVSNVRLRPDDQRWIGAWWLGPLVAAVAQMAAALPISLFGSELPASKKVRELRQNQAHMTSSMHLSAKLGGLNFFQTTHRLLKNPCFVFITLSMVMEGMCMTGLGAFLPKFVQNQFGVTAASAALWTGIAVIPAAAGGLVLGGWVAKQYKLDIRQSIKMIIVLAAMAAVGSSFIWIRCEHKQIYGVNEDYRGNPTSSNPSKTLVSPCNARCNCDTDLFDPICGDGTHIYFSPCHAGCTNRIGNQYMNCACLETLSDSHNTTALAFTFGRANLTLTSGLCKEPCPFLYVFIALLFITLCLCFIPIAPGDAIQLRCVHEDYKTHAQGIKTFVVRTLGSFMGPIVVGKLLDLNCNVWRKKCAEALSCWLYDQDMLVTSLFIFILICKGGSIFFCCFALKFYKPPADGQQEVVESCLDTGGMGGGLRDDGDDNTEDCMDKESVERHEKGATSNIFLEAVKVRLVNGWPKRDDHWQGEMAKDSEL